MPDAQPVFDPQRDLLEIFDKSFGKYFGLAKFPLHSLDGDDDWTFVIKMHAYLEAALNDILIKHFNNPALNSIIRDLELAHDRRGKLAFIKAFGLLPSNACLFVKTLATFRAQAVHGVKGLNLDLSKHFGELSKSDLDRWTAALTWWFLRPVTERDRELAIKYPRKAIFNCMMQIMAKAFVRGTIQDPRKQEEQDRALRGCGEFWSYPLEEEKPLTPNPSPP
jgi:hypothetical protein